MSRTAAAPTGPMRTVKRCPPVVVIAAGRYGLSRDNSPPALPRAEPRRCTRKDRGRSLEGLRLRLASITEQALEPSLDKDSGQVGVMDARSAAGAGKDNTPARHVEGVFPGGHGECPGQAHVLLLQLVPARGSIRWSFSGYGPHSLVDVLAVLFGSVPSVQASS